MAAPAADGRPSKLQRIKLNAMLVGSSCRALGRRQRASPAVGTERLRLPARLPARLPGSLPSMRGLHLESSNLCHGGPPPRDLMTRDAAPPLPPP
eukprot:COSAG01_NODE_40345_length_464_cov_1107.057534_1_plen_94_part_10